MMVPVAQLIRAPLLVAKWACFTALSGLLLVPSIQQLGAEEQGQTADQAIAELKAMVADPRDTEEYELDFEPLAFDRILVRDRLGENKVFHYMTFRLRNRVSDSADYLTKHASVYNEVLDGMVREYGFLRKETEGGIKLVVDDVQALEDERMATILERVALKARPRKVNLTVVGYDQHGTRFRLFDVDPGNGPQEDFNFADRSLVVAKSNYYKRVHEVIEERYRQRLYTTHEIRDLQIPVYQPDLPTTFPDGYGMAQGEVNGVIIFDRLNDLGNEFTFYLNGLSNKQRFSWPEILPQGKVEDYFNMRATRRTFVVRLSRTGDEYNLDRKPFTIRSSGWKWVERFLRLEQRRAIAYSRYYQHNIRLPEEARTDKSYTTVDDNGNAVQGTTQVAVLHDAGVAADFWSHYDRIRSTWPERYEQIIAAHKVHGEKVREPYVVPEDAMRVTEEEVARKQAEDAAWADLLQRHQALLNDRKDKLDDRLPTMQPEAEKNR